MTKNYNMSLPDSEIIYDMFSRFDINPRVWRTDRRTGLRYLYLYTRYRIYAVAGKIQEIPADARVFTRDSAATYRTLNSAIRSAHSENPT